MKKDTFCIFAWSQVVIRTSGKISPCCAFSNNDSNIKSISIEDFYNSEHMNTIRSKMLSGETVASCSACYKEESLLGNSMRTDANRDYGFFSPKHHLKLLQHFSYDKASLPKRIELHVGNLCNLKCLTCCPNDSSSFLAEDKLLNISNHNQSDYNIKDDILDSLLEIIQDDRVEIIDLRGGESLLVPKIKTYLRDLNSDITSKKMLRIQTNGTIFDQEWAEIFQKFKKVRLMISIDAYGVDNTYIRFPADWQTILKTIDQIKKIKNVQYFFNVIISNLNWLVLDKLLDWVNENKIPCSFSLVWKPNHYHVTNLPKEILVQRTLEIKQSIAKSKHLINNPQLSSIVEYVENYQKDLDPELWNSFCKIVSIRDKHRKNSIFDLYAALEKYWV